MILSCQLLFWLYLFNREGNPQSPPQIKIGQGNYYSNKSLFDLCSNTFSSSRPPPPEKEDVKKMSDANPHLSRSDISPVFDFRI